MKRIKIGDKLIGENCPVFIIAEAGVNHNGSLDLAISMVDEAVNFGADCIKFQTFITDNVETKQSIKPSYFLGRDSNIDKISYLKSLELSKDQLKEIKDYCGLKGIMFLSTVSEYGGLDLLLSIGVQAIKIGSTDTNNLPLLRRVARTNLPVLLSTGISVIGDVVMALENLRNYGAKDIAILHCTSEYPCRPEELNLKVVGNFINKFDCPIGFSDHSIGSFAAVAAVALGAKIIEKHFTLDRKLPGVDHPASAEPGEMQELVRLIRITEKSLGNGEKIIQPNEAEHLLTMRKSVVAAKEIPKGTVLNDSHITCKRPGTGILPKDFDKVAGRRSKIDISKDVLITWDMLE